MKKVNLVETIIELIFVALYLTLFILLMLAAKNQWDEGWTIIFMSSILVLSLIGAVYPLIKKESITKSELAIVIICFLLLIFAVIVFGAVSTGIYREPFIQVSSALVGGLLALYGVGMTIKYNRLDKEKDEINKAKPNIFPIGREMWSSLDKTSKTVRTIEINEHLTTLEKAKKGDVCYGFDPFFLANSDQSMCTIKGIIINDNEFIVFQYDNVLLKEGNYCFILEHDFKYSDEIKTIQFVTGDMLGNTYGCYMSFILDEKKGSKRTPIYITSTLKIKQIDVEKNSVFGLKE